MNRRSPDPEILSAELALLLAFAGLRNRKSTSMGDAILFAGTRLNVRIPNASAHACIKRFLQAGWLETVGTEARQARGRETVVYQITDAGIARLDATVSRIKEVSSSAHVA